MLVEFITDIDSPSGYSNFARAFIRAVSEAGVNCKITPSKHDRTTIPMDDWWSDNIVEMINNQGSPDIKMHIETPEFFRPSRTTKSIGFTFWETDRIPSEALEGEPPLPAHQWNWVKQMNFMDEMWTSATFAAESFMVSGVNVPCRVIGIPMNGLDENDTEELDIRNISVDMGERHIPRSDRPIVISSIAQWTRRKNLEDALTAVCVEFGSNEVIFLLKTYGTAQNVIEEEKKIRQRLTSVKYMLGLKNMPRVVLIQNTLSDHQMRQFYNSVDIFLSTSRGEGFCIPTAQAMLHGIPTIATGWSAFTDYIIPGETGWLIDNHMEPVYGMPHIPWYRPNQQWAKVDMNDLMSTLRTVYNGIRNDAPGTGVRAIANNGCCRIKKEYSRKAIGERAVHLFERTLES